eukprot:7385436-Prymnesium_polylepis.1
MSTLRVDGAQEGSQLLAPPRVKTDRDALTCLAVGECRADCRNKHPRRHGAQKAAVQRGGAELRQILEA